MDIKRIIVGDIAANCYLVSSKGEIGVIDPGEDGKKVINEVLNTEGILKFIINTHYHPDHAFSDLEIKSRFNAKILYHGAEKQYLDFTADIYLKEGDKINIGDEIFEVLHTPGHSAGSICLLSGNVIFTGDTLFLDGIGRTDLPGGSDMAMESSLERLSRVIRPGMAVYPGHGEAFIRE